MLHYSRLLVLALAVTLTSLSAQSPDPVCADDTHDYSRFSDGPRRVPVPRGASLERAQTLGLGLRTAASRLLRSSPPTSWVRAARGSISGELHWPVDGGRFGRGFGFTRHRRPELRHNGVDIVAPEGTVVRAVADGIVAYSDNGIRGFGNCVIIVHPNGWVSLYAHHYRNTVQPGWRVRRGERIGLVGNTGISRGPHLHFELRAGGRLTDPMQHLGAPAQAGPVLPWADGTLPPAEEPVEGQRTASQRPAALATTRAASSQAGSPEATTEGFDGLGRRGLLRALRRGLPDDLVNGSAERTFGTLLWPARGGRPGPISRRGLTVAGARGEAVRAAADGQVLFSGPLARRGHTVALVHRNGWITLYGGVTDPAVRPGERVLRGEWIAKVGDSADAELGFELFDSGRRRNPGPLLVQVPAAL